MTKLLTGVCCVCFCLSSYAADFNAPNSNYLKTGISKDRFDHRYYDYVEAGKTVPINEHLSVNGYIGTQSEGSGKSPEPKNSGKWEEYGEVWIELRF